jgi:hypothetical protein
MAANVVTDPAVAAELWALNGTVVPGARHVLTDPAGELPPVVHEERPALLVIPSGLLDMPARYFDPEELAEFFDEIMHAYNTVQPGDASLQDNHS